MAYDSTNKKLYVDESAAKGGITPWDIAQCIGDYRVTKLGRDFGLLCSSPNINKWSPVKPFRNSAWKFDTVDERDNARRLANQGLLLPTATNAGVAASPAYRTTYLNHVTYMIMMGNQQVPNYTYLQPRGASYNEPFRLLDFDGYMHKAQQPFQTIIMGMEKGSGRTDLNRFVQNTLVCRIVKNANSIAMPDLINDVESYYYFTAEVYLDTDRSDSNAFYARQPDYTYVASQPVSELVNANDYQDIIISLDSSLDNRYVDIVIGINKFYPDVNDSKENGQKIPASEGKGFVEPWEQGKYPYYQFIQRYYGVLDLQQENGYYLKSGASTFSSFGLNELDYTYKNTASDKVGISVKLKRASENYYVTGAKANYAPSDKVRYKFRLIRQGSSGDVAVVGTLASSDMMSDVSLGYVTINASGDEYQTIYLRFDSFLPNSGDQVGFATLEISTDDGTSWTPLGEVNQGNSSSSVHLYLKRI